MPRMVSAGSEGTLTGAPGNFPTSLYQTIPQKGPLDAYVEACVLRPVQKEATGNLLVTWIALGVRSS